MTNVTNLVVSTIKYYEERTLNKLNRKEILNMSQQNRDNFYEILKTKLKTYFNKKENIGYLYCIHNKMYNIYGEHVYKIGKSINLENRFNYYVTVYIDPIKVMIQFFYVYSNQA
jgi:hypothetical protein